MEGSDEVEAVVQVEGEEIRYRRAGRGPAVLLLRRNPHGGIPSGGRLEGDSLFRELAEGQRVIAPLSAPPGRRGAMERWLRGIIEGLGLQAPDLVAEASLAPLLTRFVGRSGGVVRRVVFLAEEEPAGSPEPATPRAGPLKK
jgi:hypothetical protein